MSIEKMLNKDIDRREFLKGTSRAAVGLTGLLSGCAPALKETRQDIINQKWDTNPLIPIPKDGCYAGSDMRTSMISEVQVQTSIDLWENLTGKKPAIQSVGLSGADTINENFPKDVCNVCIKNGVIPLIRYSVSPVRYDKVYKGEFDKELREFAGKVKHFKHPVFFNPFPEINANRAWHFLMWGGQPASSARKALRYIHNILESEGANNAISVIQYLTDKCPLWVYPEEFYPGDDVVDWIGFTVRSRITEYVGPMQHIFNQSYSWARKKHPTKPIILIELGAIRDKGQADWFTNAYKLIKNKYHAVKAVMCSPGGMIQIGEDSSPTPETQTAFKKILSEPYFIEKIPFKK